MLLLAGTKIWAMARTKTATLNINVIVPLTTYKFSCIIPLYG